ncbi:MAG: hypothetical protein ACOZBL_00515 [Patescibacteria group bacterium]
MSSKIFFKNSISTIQFSSDLSGTAITVFHDFLNSADTILFIFQVLTPNQSTVGGTSILVQPFGLKVPDILSFHQIKGTCNSNIALNAHNNALYVSHHFNGSSSNLPKYSCKLIHIFFLSPHIKTFFITVSNTAYIQPKYGD